MDEQGVTYRETLEGLLSRAKSAEKRREIEAELAVPLLPEAARYLWDVFSRLSRRRGSSGFGPARITWLDLDAFNRLSGLGLAPWEIEVLEALDDEYFASLAPPNAAD